MRAISGGGGGAGRPVRKGEEYDQIGTLTVETFTYL
jgi:hypothetical protein